MGFYDQAAVHKYKITMCNEHLWDELERLRAKTNRPTSVLDLTNALMAEWKQVLSAMFQHLVESLSRRVEAVITAKGGPTPY